MLEAVRQAGMEMAWSMVRGILLPVFGMRLSSLGSVQGDKSVRTGTRNFEVS